MKYRVNLDFDTALGLNNPKYQNNKYIKELEYIFFLVNDDISNSLYSTIQYEDHYLESLRSLGFTIAAVTQDPLGAHNWWGDIENFETSQMLNSKCWLASWHQPLDDIVVKSREELRESFPSYYRSDQGFSGIGNQVLYSQKDYARLKYPGVQSRFVEVIQTFGITYNLKTGSYFIVENLTDTSGKFKGGRLTNREDLKVNIELEQVVAKLKKHIVSIGVDIENIQFDNMIFKNDKNELKLCPLVEINYRKTMGLVIKSVSDILGEGTLYFGSREFLDSESIILSPSHVRNICFFNRA